MRTYSPADFLSKLSKSELPDLTDMTIGGLVRADEKSPSVIHFSNSLSGDKWLTLPIDIIESIDHLNTVTYKDHQYPLVKIKFKQPDEARQDLVFFLNLLSQLQNFISRPRNSARTGTTSMKFRDSSDDCAIVSTENSLDLCCMDDDYEVTCTPL